MSPRPKRILFGVSGGIAAYKAPDLLHGWVKLGCEVETILTEAAEQFVSPLALSTLSKRRVWRERDFLSAEYGWQIPHISLTDWADLFVIAPCTANVLRAAAQGDGSTLLGAALLANTKPLLLFPAMNGKMLASGPVQEHIKILKERGAEIVDPDSGLIRVRRTVERIYVPEGHVLPLGDNRDNSRDGRYFGPVGEEDINGKVLFRFWPPGRIGGLE